MQKNHDIVMVFLWAKFNPRDQKMTLQLLLTALALALIIEGLIPALFPNKWRAYVIKLAEETPQSIRSIGITIIVIGLIILWLSQ